MKKQPRWVFDFTSLTLRNRLKVCWKVLSGQLFGIDDCRMEVMPV